MCWVAHFHCLFFVKFYFNRLDKTQFRIVYFLLKSGIAQNVFFL